MLRRSNTATSIPRLELHHLVTIDRPPSTLQISIWIGVPQVLLAGAAQIECVLDGYEVHC